MIHNKSSHPVDIKKISIRLWSLRDEIEAAVERRIKECEAAGIPLYIDDIKKYYHEIIPGPLPDNVIALGAKKEDGITDLMESLGPKEENPEEKPSEATEENSLSQAEQIISEQAKQGLETNKLNPILERPFQRQAPDTDKIIYGFTILSDINMDSLLSFTKERFMQGQLVIVEFLIPQSFKMMAKVNYCHNYGLRSKIISSTKPDFRLQCKFIFAIPGERDTLRNFLKSIEPTIEKKKVKKEAEDDSLGV
ncbi:MAG: hypothetical protein AB7I27_14625 [Bacteriovoracaceae bacterium]